MEETTTDQHEPGTHERQRFSRGAFWLLDQTEGPEERVCRFLWFLRSLCVNPFSFDLYAAGFSRAVSRTVQASHSPLFSTFTPVFVQVR